MRKITVSDYTLKELCGKNGSQLLFREKLSVAVAASRYGADIIELPPVKKEKEDAVVYKTICQSVKGAKIMIGAGSTVGSVEKAALCIREAQRPVMQVSLPVSTVQMEYMYRMKGPKMLELISTLVEKCRSYSEEVEFEALDATRAEMGYLLECFNAAAAAGATSIAVSDDNGEMMGDELYDFVSEIKKNTTLPLTVKVSDHLSMGVSDALFALKAGADGIKCSVSGKDALSTDALASALSAKGEKIGVRSSLKFTEIHSDIESLLKSVGRSDKEEKEESMEGSVVFLDASSTPEECSAAVRSLGYDLSVEDEKKVYDAVKRLTEKKSSIGGKELEAVVASSAMQVPATYTLKSYVSTISNMVNAVSNVTLEDENGTLVGVAVGDGPIDSAFKAIETCIGHHYELDDFQIQAVTEGKEALGSALVRLRSDGRLYSGNGISTDICGASIRAYVNALNKIAYEEGHAK
ncbi:MAG: alpha-isopropylmalate synthase regulatory domain-containing protein [Candidatus Ornithospirochaeta sp.]